MTRVRKTVAAIGTTVLLAVPMAGVSSSAEAAAGPHAFKNCTALNKQFHHGVGRPGAKDKTSGDPVTNFKKSRPLYLANNGPRSRRTGEYDLDRDNDGIACEAH